MTTLERQKLEFFHSTNSLNLGTNIGHTQENSVKQWLATYFGSEFWGKITLLKNFSQNFCFSSKNFSFDFSRCSKFLRKTKQSQAIEWLNDFESIKSLFRFTAGIFSGATNSIVFDESKKKCGSARKKVRKIIKNGA